MEAVAKTILLNRYHTTAMEHQAVHNCTFRMETTMKKTPETEITNRIHRLKQQMETQGIDAMFLTHKPDLFYFSGTGQDAYLFIPLNNDPILFVKRYLPRAWEESSIDNCVQIDSVTAIPGLIQDSCPRRPKNIGIAFDVVPVRDYRFFKKLFDGVDIVDGTKLIADLRMIKSAHEIDKMQAAARLSKQTFDFIKKNLRPGYTEMEFCGIFEAFARKKGHSGTLLRRHYRSEAFAFHLLSGKSGGLPGSLGSPICGTGTSALSSFGAGHKKIKANEPVLIDFGTFFDNYHMDETRMFSIGPMEKKAADAAGACIDILLELLQWMKPGTPMGGLFDQSVTHAKKLGYENEFLGLADLKSTFIGHGIGIELVEYPILAKGKKSKLKPGMVFAVEPKMIFKNRFAVGVESVVLITENGGELISRTDHKAFIC